MLTCLLGIPAGIGGFTFVYAKGYSYLSTDPRTCLNCHGETIDYARQGQLEATRPARKR